jgi:cytochrome c oxidase assembly protein subunit 11
VQFTGTLMPGLPWEIRPLTPPSKSTRASCSTTRFLVRNLSDQTIVGQAVPSVSPTVAAQHFEKLDCFCFTQQTLAPGESREMPLTFIVNQTSTTRSANSPCPTHFSLTDSERP